MIPIPVVDKAIDNGWGGKATARNQKDSRAARHAVIVNKVGVSLWLMYLAMDVIIGSAGNPLRPVMSEEGSQQTS